MDISRHIISIDAPAIEALRRLNDLSGSNMTLFAIDADGRMIGTLTDGDVRRALVDGGSLDTPTSEIMCRTFRHIDAENINPLLLRSYRESGISLVPVLDADRRPTDAIDLRANHTRLPLSAVLMAGGKGERLRPLTLHTPKPLLQLGGKAIIDYNIEAMVRCGITDIYVTVRYLADKIRQHMSQPIEGVMVKCVEEDTPLGTIGSAALCNLPEDGASIVMNSDILTNISFEDMYIHHQLRGADITVAVIPYKVSVPFAIMTSDNEDPMRIAEIEEKPVYSYFANAGIYIVPNNILRNLPTARRTDATDMLEKAVADGLKVCQYPLNGTWIDIGSPADFDKAAELLRYVNG